ncbi:MAG: DNA recombination protein RmuC, partial [Kiritimatiellae bacterium]|nr:DNA recombination protein RmuC [Kiritimatiellia bacterium]
MEKNIIMVTPSNLLATLRIVSNIWRTEHQNRHASEIAEKAGSLYDKFVAFVEDIEGIDKHLEKAKEALGESRRKLSTGKGNLVKRAQDLLNMGVKAKKKLPASIATDDGDNL